MRLVLGLVLVVLMLGGCGSEEAATTSSGGVGSTYYAVKRTNGYVSATNGPFTSLNSCQEYLASPSGQAPAWIGASCIQSDSRPQ